MDFIIYYVKHVNTAFKAYVMNTTIRRQTNLPMDQSNKSRYEKVLIQQKKDKEVIIKQSNISIYSTSSSQTYEILE
jgi:hypothetical protein